MSNAPDPMADFRARHRREEERRRWRPEVMARYACGALRFFGVESVTVSFDTYTNDPNATCPFAVPQLTPPLAEPPYGLEGMLVDICEHRLPDGWDGGGACGTLSLDVATGAVELDISCHDYDEEME